MRHRDLKIRVKRLVAVVVITTMLAACSTTKQLQREDFAAASRQPIAVHVVTTNDGHVYRVRSFSVTDSTFVIKEMTDKDEQPGGAAMPIVLPLADVATVETKDMRGGVFLIVVPLLLLTFLFYGMRDIHLD
ncbi:MAG TPA: hypothetical protein VFX92_07565 [Candidatus Krumholzibacteria bacterium]|nr:hypothetical protein [Candidatus Krumholzibacteria bacterium]